MKRLLLTGVFSLLCVICVSGSVLAGSVDDLAQLNAWADKSLQALIDHYWIPSESYLSHWDDNRSARAGFWTVAQAWDSIMDGVERTGGVNSKWFTYLERLYQGQSNRNYTFINQYYDDMAWWTLASIRAYGITNDKKYLNRALSLWSVIRSGWDDDLGGGIWWRSDQKGGKNACINSPAAIIGAKLYQVTGDREHLEWSIKIYNWVRANLASTGLVYDNIRADGTIDYALYTYNQGTYIGAGVELYKSTGDAQYLEDARKAANLGMVKFADKDGILKSEGQGDGGGFKGILVRYLVSLIEVDPEPQSYMDFLMKNATSVGTYAFNEKDLIGPYWGQPEAGPVHMLTHVSGVMLLNLVASALQSEIEYGVTIKAPKWNSTVMANQSVVLEVAPSIDIAEVRVVENGVEIYRGASVPQELRLAAPVNDAEEWHTLVVTVNDREGLVRTRSTGFRVHRLVLKLPELDYARMRGSIDISMNAAFQPGDHIARYELALQGVGGSEPVKTTLLYRGASLPKTMQLDTIKHNDGTYDLTLSALTDAGTVVAQSVHRIVIKNWETLSEPFAPPTNFFGTQFDALKTEQRSDAWIFKTEHSELFFGDEDRIAAPSGSEEYLIWSYPGLNSFTLTVYAKDASLGNVVDVAVSPDMESWYTVGYQVEATAAPGNDRYKLVLNGDITLAQSVDYLRVIIRPEGQGDDGIQLGHLVLKRPVGD